MPRSLPNDVYSTLGPMSAEELEAGLGKLSRVTDREAFWNDNICAFRQTVLTAISETTEALSANNVPATWGKELEQQLISLRECLALADRYLYSRTLN